MPMNPQQVIQMLFQGGNPQQMMQSMMQQNPQMRAIFNQQKQSGMTMEQYARQYAKQNNINIDQMIDTMKKRGMKF